MWFYIFVEALFWVFAIMGFIELLQKISNQFYVYGKNKLEDISVVVTVRRREDKIEYILRSLLVQLEGIATRRGQPDIYVVDAGMDNETFDIVAAFCEDHDNVVLCREREALNCMAQKMRGCDIMEEHRFL
jgi:cellulose synthase/poly-beta-1,6-N-acetylglucosamine synthase-like glycosyltransferase